jgi:hypothetical protein
MSPSSAGCGHWSAPASVGQAVQLCLVPSAPWSPPFNSKLAQWPAGLEGDQVLLGPMFQSIEKDRKGHPYVRRHRNSKITRVKWAFPMSLTSPIARVVARLGLHA